MFLRIRDLILMAIFIALAVAGGLVMAQIPNVELVSVTIFLSGMLLGIGRGIVVGAVAEFLYSSFNPYGVAAPPLLIAQVISMMLIGAAGGVIKNLYGSRVPPVWLLGLAGFLLTFIFDLLTTLSFTVVVGSGLAGFLTAVAFGLYFYLAHEASNALAFGLMLPLLLRQLRHLPFFQPAVPIAKTLQRRDLQPSLSLQAERES
jgi:hypothetical protein